MGELLKSLKKRGLLTKALILLIVGILLIVISSFGKDSAKESEGESLSEYKERLEGEIASLCSDVDGVGKCKVFITFERGEQNIYKGSLVTESKPPKILGVTVICRGAGSDEVRHELTEMLTALFDIGSNRVAVLKLN